MVICDYSIIQRLALASRSCFQGLPESVLLDFLDAEPLHVSLPQAEDEAGLAKFEVDLNEGRLDQVGEVLQMNGGGLVRTPKSLLFIRSGAFGSVWSGSWRFVAVRGGSWRFVAVREIHLASECALQGLLRPIGTRGEANLVSPRGF